jgi:membrane protease YdiL (CAAX protease family)
MSHQSIALPAGALPALPATPRASTQSQPLSIWFTLGWTAAGIFIICAFVAVNEAWRFWSGSVAWPMSAGGYVQPFLHFTVIAMVALVLRHARIPVRNYLALVGVKARDVFRSIGWGLVGWAILVGVAAALAGLQFLIYGMPPDQPTAAGSTDGTGLTGMQIAVAIVFVWIMMVVAAPLAEEILYRGFFYRGLRATRLGVAGTILVTSVTFGLLHKVGGFGWDRVVVTTCLGLLLGWLRQRTGGLTVPIMTHMVINIPGSILATAGILMMA